MIIKTKNKNSDSSEAMIIDIFFRKTLNKSIIYKPLLLNMLGL